MTCARISPENARDLLCDKRIPGGRHVTVVRKIEIAACSVRQRLQYETKVKRIEVIAFGAF